MNTDGTDRKQDVEIVPTFDMRSPRREALEGLHARPTGAGLRLNSLTDRIIRVFYEVYNELGHGFLESVYERAMEISLRRSGVDVSVQRALPVHFRGELIGDFRADLIVADSVIVELKAARAIDAVHEAQVLNYLRASDIEVGLLLNFGPKPQIKRYVYDNPRKQIRAHPR